MQILVDSQPYPLGDAETPTVQELADAVCKKPGQAEERLVVSLVCDGQPISPETLQDTLNKPVRSFETIELRTVSVREQVSATLNQALDVIQQAGRICSKTADDLNQGDQASAMSGLRDLLEILKQVQQTTFLSSRLLDVPLDSIKAGDQDLNSILGAIRERLDHLKSGMESQDFVLVADTLRYELAEPLEAWGELLRVIRAAAEKR